MSEKIHIQEVVDLSPGSGKNWLMQVLTAMDQLSYSKPDINALHYHLENALESMKECQSILCDCHIDDSDVHICLQDQQDARHMIEFSLRETLG